MVRIRQHTPLVFSVWACIIGTAGFLLAPVAYATTIPSAIVEEVNHARSTHDLVPLQIDPLLTYLAEERLVDIQETGTFSHESSDGRMPWDLAEQMGFSYVILGENLAEGYQTASAAVAGWLASSSHRANILNADYQLTGVAVGNGHNGSLIVQIFAKPSQEYFEKSWFFDNNHENGVASIISESLSVEHDSIIRLTKDNSPVDIFSFVLTSLLISQFP